MSDRRGFLLGLGAFLAAPAIVRADSLMRVAVLRETILPSVVPFGSQVYWLGAQGIYMLKADATLKLIG